jgi:hypothetical protein
MGRFQRLILALAALATMASGQEVPSANPAEVWVKGRKMDHSWRDGRIWVPTGQLQPLLNLSSDMPSVDLLKSLEAKGGYTWAINAGKFEAKPDPSLYSVGGGTAGAARPSAGYSQVTPARSAESGRLTYRVQEFTADTGFVRAYVAVTNEGPGRSDPSEMVTQFQDGFGRTYATDRDIIGELEPGETQVFECFSMVRAEDTSIKTSDGIAVNFFSQTDPSKNPQSASQARKQAKQSNRSKSGLNFNRGYSTINSAAKSSSGNSNSGVWIRGNPQP